MEKYSYPTIGDRLGRVDTFGVSHFTSTWLV